MSQFEEIIDSVFSKAKSAVNFAGQKTSELVGIGKLKYQKEVLSRDITKAYAKLGAVVYEAKIGDGDLEGLVDAGIEELKDLNNQLDVVEKEMEGAKQEFTSPIEEEAENIADEVSEEATEFAEKVTDKAHDIADDIKKDIGKSDNVLDVTDKINEKADRLVKEVDDMSDEISTKLNDDKE